ncbi:unnamed protein product [Vitrella brassicaformis CCMP3155]|uniref:C3H1-type domain-containing protein n=1 Tax=Vitrella brassicaformis (strain CCMP3155) TaxID=1169540 RepID=A0A0G4EBR4_VITBC|nr:unnamed protein product [Vitrella brassicaformis CCMP3155]|eukprot:CEL92738.1 unnamed protein product [Vitrella brassicaformis CCMP3155]
MPKEHILIERYAKTKLCPFQPQGKCKKGDKCKYAHSTDELRPMPDLRKTKMCVRFMEGGCNDQFCNFAHSAEELRATPDLFKTAICPKWQRGECRNPDCRYAHGEMELRPRATLEASQNLPVDNTRLQPHATFAGGATLREFANASNSGMTPNPWSPFDGSRPLVNVSALPARQRANSSVTSSPGFGAESPCSLFSVDAITALTSGNGHGNGNAAATVTAVVAPPYPPPRPTPTPTPAPVPAAPTHSYPTTQDVVAQPMNLASVQGGLFSSGHHQHHQQQPQGVSRPQCGGGVHTNGGGMLSPSLASQFSTASTSVSRPPPIPTHPPRFMSPELGTPPPEPLFSHHSQWVDESSSRSSVAEAEPELLDAEAASEGSTREGTEGGGAGGVSVSLPFLDSLAGPRGTLWLSHPKGEIDEGSGRAGAGAGAAGCGPEGGPSMERSEFVAMAMSRQFRAEEGHHQPHHHQPHHQPQPQHGAYERGCYSNNRHSNRPHQKPLVEFRGSRMPAWSHFDASRN